MKAWNVIDIPRLTDEIAEAAAQGEVFIWWDLSNGEFLKLDPTGVAARHLLGRLQPDPLAAFVGVFDARCPIHEIRAALVAHCRGALAA